MAGRHAGQATEQHRQRARGRHEAGRQQGACAQNRSQPRFFPARSLQQYMPSTSKSRVLRNTRLYEVNFEAIFYGLVINSYRGHFTMCCTYVCAAQADALCSTQLFVPHQHLWCKPTFHSRALGSRRPRETNGLRRVFRCAPGSAHQGCGTESHPAELGPERPQWSSAWEAEPLTDGGHRQSRSPQRQRRTVISK